MALVKIGKINKHVDISEQKVRDLVKSGVWKDGVHYFDNAHLGHRLFDMDVILDWVKGSEPKNKVMMELARKLAG